MKFNTYKLGSLLLLGVTLFAVSCFKDLDTLPLNENEFTSANVYDSPGAYRQVLAKLYAGLALSGQQGPDGKPDISGIDEGFSTYIRQYWKAQELTTDEAVIAWNDGNIHDYEQQDWDEGNEFIAAMYNRIFFQISLCNEFLRETTDAKLDSRGVSGALRDEVTTYRAEARFLRALSYWHALDMFRNVPFVTEEDQVGFFFPRQASAEEVFTFVENELKAIESELVAPRMNEYGRADQAAAWMVLAKLYLNSNVYLGRDRYTDCVTYCNKILSAGYTMDSDYAHMFMADNDQADGIIFSVNFDGRYSRTWGGMTFICHAAVGGNMSAAAFGLDGGWGGTRVTKALVEKFPAVQQFLVQKNAGASYSVITAPGNYPGATRELATRNNDNTYEGYINFPNANGEFSFKLATGETFGDNGADGTLEQNGANIVIADPGYYKVNVDFNAMTYSLLKTTWGLIGDATPGGWSSDQDMSYDPAQDAWVIKLNLTAGKVKFRANDEWVLDYGDPNGNALLSQSGADINIPDANRYLIKLFLNKPDYTYSIERIFDNRAKFHIDGQELEIVDVSKFDQGYAVTKFTNVRSDGTPGSNPTWVDTDFPMFRIEDAYLMYAEAILRGGTGGDVNTAVGYINQIRERAYKGYGTDGNVTANDLTLDFILDERARELYWECHRRTDLIRFGKFSNTTYLWPWKGNSPDGESRPSFYDVFPIPASDLGANPNLEQNDGY